MVVNIENLKMMSVSSVQKRITMGLDLSKPGTKSRRIRQKRSFPFADLLRTVLNVAL